MSNEVEKTDQLGSAVVPADPMAMIGQAVADGAPIEKLQALMELQERWEANEARKAFSEALTLFKEKPPSLTKDSHVSYELKTGGKTEYDHATLNQVSTVIGEALSKHGLSHRWDVEQPEGGQIMVTCILMHRAGHSERVSMNAGRDESGSKNTIQALGSTVTYLQRYTLLAVTGMSAGDTDTDGIVPKGPISEAQVKELTALLDEAGADKIRFVKYMGVDSLPEIDAGDYNKALFAINAKKNEEAKNEDS